MALNPFFLQGSPGEQRLIQELINEQLKIYGVEVIYIPRKYVRRESIIEEVTTSKFDDNFGIEAYVNNYEGYSGAGDVLTKFGMSLRDELSLIISKERFEDFIGSFLDNLPESETGGVTARPREGDVIYFPLGKRLFEVKFVEHEKPFYQLGKTYVYELQCELFEYEDEMGGWDNLNTTTDEIDSTLENFGYITTLQLFGSGQQAEVVVFGYEGGLREVILSNDGYGYTGVPTVSIEPSGNGSGTNAEAVAITTSVNGTYSVKEILLTNPGLGYTFIPEITISGGNGVGAAATAIVNSIDEEENYSHVGVIIISNAGSGYPSEPVLTFSDPQPGIGITATGRVAITTTGSISQVLITNTGYGYTDSITATVALPPITAGIGTFQFNEVVTGSISGATGRVKTWDKDTSILKIGTTSGDFVPGDVIVGSASSATYSVHYEISAKFTDKYEQNDEIEEEADLIVDFTESNPFGNY